MKFQFEPLTHLLKTGLSDLGYSAFKECGYGKDLSYDMNWGMYAEKEQQNACRWLAVRDDDDVLIGYASVFIGAHPYDKKICIATIQDIFLDKQFRKGMRPFNEFMDFLEKILKDIGVKFLTGSECLEDERGGIGAVWQRRGYHCDHKLWTKEL